MKTLITSLCNEWFHQNLNFCCISHEKTQATQHQHALRKKFLRTLCWSNDNFNPGCNWKMLIGKISTILDKFFFEYEQLFYQKQSNAWEICQHIYLEKLFLLRATAILSTSCFFLIFEVQIVYRWRYKKHISLSESVLKFAHTFHLPFYVVHFRQEVCFLESIFSMSLWGWISTTVSVSFSGEVFCSCNYNMIKSQYWLSWEKDSYRIQTSNSSWNK